MYTILISVFAGGAVGVLFRQFVTDSTGWSIFWGVLGFFVCLFLLGLLLRRRIAAAMADMQLFLTEGQKALQARITAYQNRPTGDPRRFLETVQRKQNELLTEALAHTDGLERFRNWIPLFGRQINTTRMQFHYQLKQFDKVDELLPKCLVLDPMSASMKLARQFSKDAPVEEMEKTYRKARARLRYNQSALLSALMSWIYVRKNRTDDAYALLEKACRDNSVDEGPNETLKRNRDALANNRVKQFSNAGFGDQWYALFLEEPRIRYERRPPTRFGRFG